MIASPVRNPPDVAFEKNGVKYGWRTNLSHTLPMVVPGMWTAAAIAVALGRSGAIEESERGQVVS